MDPDPLGGCRLGHTAQLVDHARAGATRQDAWDCVAVSDPDHDIVEASVVTQDARQLRQHGFGRGPRREQPRHAVQRPGVTLARRRNVGARALHGRQLAYHDTNEEQQRRADPDAGLAHSQRVARFGEEEVVQQESGDRRGNGAARAADYGRGNHRNEEDRGRIRDAEAILEHANGDGCERQRGDCNHQESGDGPGLGRVHLLIVGLSSATMRGQP